jgi:hypothetical protein
MRFILDTSDKSYSITSITIFTKSEPREILWDVKPKKEGMYSPMLKKIKYGEIIKDMVDIVKPRDLKKGVTYIISIDMRNGEFSKGVFEIGEDSILIIR